MSIRSLAICLALLGPGVCAMAEDGLPAVMTVDGQSFSGKLTRIAKGEVVFRVGSAERSVAFTELRSIRFGGREELMTRPGRAVVVLAGARGQQLGVGGLSVKDGKISVDSALLGAAVIDISAARAIYLPPSDQQARACRKRHLEMKLERASHDYLVAVDKQGNWVPVPGVLKSIAGGQVGFEFKGKDRRIELASVRAIELARMKTNRPAPAGYLIGRDGSRVGFSSLALAGASLSVEIEGVEVKRVALAAVSEMRFESARFVHLSDLTPSRVVQAGLFDMTFRFRRDRSSVGSPIRLGGATYAKGLGLHSRCELTYTIAGQYVTFAATAGIDAAAEGRGNATLKILGDGKELTKPLKLVGGGRPVPVRCDLSGVKQLTILVDFGDDRVDVGDHVDLADARLIKP